jgi:NAD(P)-dependent dehydrogenase (short-subunit alcohol dehydrogenase family)
MAAGGFAATGRVRTSRKPPNRYPLSGLAAGQIRFFPAARPPTLNDALTARALLFCPPDGFIDQTDIRTSAVTQVWPYTRAGKPEEVAHDVHFLASPECSFVTAQCYDVSGGRAAY